MEPALYIVATPIGNLADISERALEVLAGASTVAAEDTRRTGQLLHQRGIDTQLAPYHEHNAAVATPALLAALERGESVALVSDAGTPTISDPGYRLVRAAQEAGHRVVPIPGACAAIAALSASGIPSDRFSFEGFLPNKSEARRARLETLKGSSATLIFYESPHRLEASLGDMRDLFGSDREAALARELTKTFETVRRATLGELIAWVSEDANQSRGELVVLVAPASNKGVDAIPPELGKLLLAMAEHMPARQAAKLLSSYAGVKTKKLYNYLVERRSS